MMPKFYVEIPVCGKVSGTVQADNEEEAIEKAMIHQWLQGDIEEWDAFEKVVEGNVCHAQPYDAFAAEQEDDGEYDIE